ncbi:MAG: EAL domain-containing protein [Candidatus Cohnella colombiensis]|uniref:EAL domain-containing protein n=1 Tax=Candidatus Cohnella colombiensis TaxID=3121368 RepID=A0AA95EY58_9BACL|nr:MAG: EAL domain-containing protein [Cohnella sp.]
MNRHSRHAVALGERQAPENFILPYARIFHESEEAIMVTDRHSRIVSVNPAFTSITGYDESEAIGQKPSILKSHYHDPEFYVKMWASIHQDGSWSGEIRNRRKNGEIYPEWLSINSIEDENGILIYYVGMFSDITLRKNTLSKLRLHAQVFSNASEGIMITDKQLKILSVNQAFTTMTGYTEREAVGHTPRLLHSGLQDQYFYIKMWESIHATGFWEGEIWNKRKNGELYPEWLSITTLRDEGGNITNYIGMFADITERKQTEEHLKYLAHFDKLTGLPNRTLLCELVNEATVRCMKTIRKFALFFIDLDRFKMVNDSLGHSVGDKLLQQVAKRLSSVVRSDDVVSRLGGDEFIIVLQHLEEPEEAILIANQLISSIKQPFSVADNELYLNASIGICMYPNHGEDFETLLKNADLAMYQAKIQNGGYQFFNENILSTFLRKLELENELRWAIAKNQITLHYQPQVSAETGDMKGMEALIRWNHPTLGPVSPGEFIPIAEETGIIMEIGKWVLKEVCAQLNRWSSKSYVVPPIAINLSARQFLAPDLASTFHDIVRQTCCNPQHIVIEITESSSMHDIESVLPILHEFKSFGFQIAIDDFGKGYSSLGYIKQFPIDILKIDLSFVQELISDSKSTVITKAIIDMSHGMNLQVIAEGVETLEQLEYLRTMNCDIVQGYVIDRPMPSEQLEASYLRGVNPHEEMVQTTYQS